MRRDLAVQAGLSNTVRGNSSCCLTFPFVSILSFVSVGSSRCQLLTVSLVSGVLLSLPGWAAQEWGLPFLVIVPLHSLTHGIAL